MKRLLLALAVLATAAIVSPAAERAANSPDRPATGIHKIRHVVVIMQENRSFDSYFGTYPGADGIPMKNGVPTVCVPDPATSRCVKPFHDTNNRNGGGPHQHIDALRDIDHGKMDGFIRQERRGQGRHCQGLQDPRCTIKVSAPEPDVMGYHDGREIPNYWTYARNFVLQDRMFQPDSSWSLPAHLFMVSGWSAKCAKEGKPMSCRTVPENPGAPPGEPQNPTGAVPHYDWTDLTYLLHRHHVSWRYYVASGGEPDCRADTMFCKSIPQNAKTPGIWNPLPWFTTVKKNRQLANVAPFHDFVEVSVPASSPPSCPTTPRKTNTAPATARQPRRAAGAR